jgi:serpin B
MRVAVAVLLVSSLGVPALAQEPEPEARAAGEGTARLAVDLYGALRSEGGNLFFSPYSLSAALAMTREGARGETAAELDRALHFPAGLAKAQAALARALRPREVDEWDERGGRRKVAAYELSVANALWGQEGLAFLAPFTGVLEREYGAPLERLDFKDQAAARRRINGWVEERTRQRIKDIVPPGLPSPDTRLALANAIHFKAAWLEPFEKEATRDAPFHAAGGDVPAKLMRRVDHLMYAADEAVQVVALPYRGHSTSMLVVLPRKVDGLAAVEAGLTAERLAGWVGGLKRVKVDVRLPRFEMTQAFEARAPLAKLGVKRAFDARQADFSGMLASEPLFVGAILHKAFVAVDEAGTEAAAATVVLMEAGSAPRPETPVDFVADRPFLFLLRHEPTGCVLFMGRLATPAR